MKRLITFLLTLTMLLTLTACGEQATAKPSVDLDRNFAQAHAYCATDDAVYFRVWMGDDAILYADKASGIGGVLCGKPECDHKGADCNAVVDYARAATPMGIADYDGALWVATGWAIYRMNYDGSGHEEIRKLDSELVTAMKFHNVFFHRGYAYYVGRTQDVEDGVPASGPFAYRVSLTDPEEEPTVIFRGVFPRRGDMADYDMVDNYLYLFVYTWGLEPDEGTPVEDSGELYIARWDSETQESQVLYDGHIGFIPYEYWVQGDSILMDNGLTVMELDWNTGTFKERFTFAEMEHGNLYFVDNKVICMTPERGFEGDYFRFPYPLVYSVRDFDGNVITSERIGVTDFGKQERGMCFVTFLGADDAAMYVQFDHSLPTDDGSETLTWLVQVPLDGGDQRTIAEYDYSVRVGEHG